MSDECSWLLADQDAVSSVRSGSPRIKETESCRTKHCSKFHHVSPLLYILRIRRA
jgi:hypothetical protein